MQRCGKSHGYLAKGRLSDANVALTAYALSSALAKLKVYGLWHNVNGVNDGSRAIDTLDPGRNGAVPAEECHRATKL